MHVLFFLAQIGILLIAFWCPVDSWRKHKMVLFLFLLFDAFIFESLILYLYNAVEYNPALFSLNKIPLMVFAGWAVLLYALSQTVESKSIFLKSIFIAQFLVSIDLVLDKAAVVGGFWSWSNTTGYFQVPYDNFFAWYAYSFLAVYFVSLFLQKITFTNLLKTFIFISISGLSLGYTWTFLPPAFQSIIWWFIFIGTFLAIITCANKIEYKSENAPLLLIPLAFYFFAFSLIAIHLVELPKYYIFISLLLFSFWLIFSIRKFNVALFKREGG